MRYLLLAFLFAATSALAEPYAFIGFAGIDGNGAAGFGAGYNITSNLGVETAYWKPSSFKEETGTFPAGSDTGSFNRTVEGSILSLAAIGRLPFGNWNMLAKLSANRINADFREHSLVVSSTLPPTVVSDITVTRSSSDWAMSFGLGVGYTFSKEVSARLFVERIERSEELDRMDAVTFQAIYSF